MKGICDFFYHRKNSESKKIPIFTLLINQIDPMPLSWNEIKDRALNFSKEWADANCEDYGTDIILFNMKKIILL